MGNEYQMRTLCLCLCKWGTQSVCPVALLDDPRSVKHTTAIRDLDNIRHGTQYSVLVDAVREDGLVMLSMH
jgi:hypothetical protein